MKHYNYLKEQMDKVSLEVLDEKGWQLVSVDNGIDYFRKEKNVSRMYIKQYGVLSYGWKIK